VITLRDTHNEGGVGSGGLWPTPIGGEPGKNRPQAAAETREI